MYMEGTYNYYIVALSCVIAILASYSALSIAAKISHADGKARFFWLFAGSFVMGSGVWSMHFVGMLAFRLHVAVVYDAGLTLLSMSASIVSSFIAFFITMPKHVRWYKLAFGGFIMGSGIVAMHYWGMEAMVMPVEMTYDRVWWTLSAIIALVASYAALLLFLRFRKQPAASRLKWLSAGIMGFAICGMHYTGMKAAIFHGDSHANEVSGAVSNVDLFLLFSVTVAIFVILLVFWGSMFFERHVLERMAYQDTITGLPNRNEMNRFFDTYVGGESIGVLFLDLDQFKAVNDTLGHHIGDMLIQEVGNRLRQFNRDDQQAFRIGGDEFLFIVRHCDRTRAERLAEHILQSVKKEFRIEGNELYVTGSIGISIGSILDSDRLTLLKTADTAMYKAKGMGKNRYCVYTEEMGRQEIRKMELEKDLQRALGHNQFFIEYQPKWNVNMNRLVGFEALIRWKHPRWGVVLPGEFIPIAEETGHIVPITRWVMEQACHQCKAWHAQGLVQPVSINVSARLFQTDNMLDLVRHVLNVTELPPRLLELEITESLVIQDTNDVIRQLRNIRELGVKISMDDFGTGYSSLGLLNLLPIDTLKLDRLFTKDIEDPSKRAIINAIMLLAESLRLNIIAEGVEDQKHIEFLKQMGCEVMQGYFYGKPMNAQELEAWLKQGNESKRVPALDTRDT